MKSWRIQYIIFDGKLKNDGRMIDYVYGPKPSKI